MAARAILLAVTGAPYEAALLRELDRVSAQVVVARRCLDLADLLAAAASGLATVAVVDAALRRLDAGAVARLAACGVTVVGVVVADDNAAGAAGDDAAVARALTAWGVGWVVPSDIPGDELVRLVDAAGSGPGPGKPVTVQGFSALWQNASGSDAAMADGSPDDSVDAWAAGRLVAIWGPAGAPGRTTLAVSLADELAQTGADTLLVDADTYAPSVAQHLALLDEGSGLAAAARTASSDVLSAEVLAGHARSVRPGLRVLTGLSRPERWPELSAAALTQIWAAARRLTQWTVVDCGFCVENDEELSYDTLAPRRNAATTVTLGAADLVLLVASADPVGVGRLIRALPEVRSLAPQAEHRVVLTHVRAGPVGRQPRRQLTELLARHGAPADPVLVPYDRPAHDAALARGQTLREAAVNSPAREAIARLAATLAATLDEALDEALAAEPPEARAAGRAASQAAGQAGRVT